MGIRKLSSEIKIKGGMRMCLWPQLGFQQLRKRICFCWYYRTKRELEMFDNPDLTFDQMVLYASGGIFVKAN